MKTLRAIRFHRYLLCSVAAAALTFVSVPSNASAASSESNVVKNFTIQPGGILSLDAERGAIRVVSDAHDQVRVFIKRSLTGATEAKAEEIFNAHEIRFDQDGNQVSVQTRLTGKGKESLVSGTIQLNVSFEIHVPQRFDLDLETAAGDITVSDIEGKLVTRTSGGNIAFGAVKGQVDAGTSAGNIQLKAATREVSLKSSGGNIEIAQTEAETSAKTSAGSIKVRRASGPLTVKTSGGAIDLGDVSAKTYAETSAGAIGVEVARGPVELRSGGGNIAIKDARNSVDAKTSAGNLAVHFTSQPAGDCQLVTSGGNIDAWLDPKLSFNVKAINDGGSIHTDLPVASTVQGEQSRGRLRGHLNGGGKQLYLKTSAGSLHIRKL